jgi:choline dehydrogenase-like flavoprotein
MLIDAREIPSGKVVKADLCIVGAGAAGLPMAREFAGSKTSVCLLEGGGFELERESQALYQGQTDGTFLPKNGRYLVTSRQRLFGGTTHTWAGFTVPLDPMDFEERDWIPESGWPMTREDLDPFYLRAYPYCQCKPVETDLERYKGTDRPILDFGPGAGIVTKLIHLSTPPTNFAKVHGPPVLEASNITTYLHASAMELESNPAGTAVTGLKAGTLAGNRFRVEASTYVLAAGGIENPRLLLLSRGVQKNGLGNDRDLVGRYFLEHPHLRAGFMVLTAPTGPLTLFEEHTHDQFLGHESIGILCASDEFLRRERLLNVSVQLYPAPRQRISEAVKGIGRMAMRVDRDFAAGEDERPANYVNLYARAEPSPDPASRVTLTDDRDALGMQRVRLEWWLSKEDGQSLQRTLRLFGRELGRLSRGRLHMMVSDQRPWPDSIGGDHHGGPTRMHVNPAKGVVDPDALVHGLDNLYIAGNSVFPTAGYANPTLTLIALAIRLADHLKGRLPS